MDGSNAHGMEILTAWKGTYGLIYAISKLSKYSAWILGPRMPSQSQTRAALRSAANPNVRCCKQAQEA